MTTYYLTKFPPSYRNRRWWRAESRDRAEKFLKKVREKYKIRGRIITVIETNKQTMKKTPKLKINVRRDDLGYYRWDMTRGGRVELRGPKSYMSIVSLTKALNRIIESLASGNYASGDGILDVK